MCDRKKGRGFVLLLTLVLMLALSTAVSSFIVSVTTDFRHAGVQTNDAKAVWLAEAGLNRAIWNLKTPAGGGGQGENWTTTGTSETLTDGSYNMVVQRWDFSLAANGGIATATTSSSGHLPASGNDGNNTTYWQSNAAPSVPSPQFITIQFPYALTINKVRFLVPTSTPPVRRPRNYTWQVSSNGTTWTTVVTVTNNPSNNVTNTFVAASNVSFLRLRVTSTSGSGANRVNIATLEAIGSKITSTGTVGGQTRTVTRTVVADDSSPENRRAYPERDWDET